MRIDFAKLLSRRSTPQSEPIPDSAQVKNCAGGYSWRVDDWMRLDRFLILGTEGGSYHASERELTRDSAEAAQRCVIGDGGRVVERVVELSRSGRAPSNDPAIFVLAMAARTGDDDTRQRALAALPQVCRTGTHLMHFAQYAELFGGWGRGMRRAVARWYNDMPAKKLAYQVIKYQSRDGWCNRDLLRLSHPRASSPAHDHLYHWVTRGTLRDGADGSLALIEAFEQARRASRVEDIVELITSRGLPREAIPSEWLASAAVWEALLTAMPMTAMIRNLATMTRVGLLAPMSPATRTVVARLGDGERLRKARVHPIAILAALMTYKAGRGARGRHSWTPVTRIVDALDAAFYASFGFIEPTGKRTLLGLDVSGSMSTGDVAGVPGLTPRVASAAMAMITAAVEKHHGFVAFTGGSWPPSKAPWRKARPNRCLRELDISPRQRLDSVVRAIDGLPFGPTDCALPMLWALENKIAVDVFVIYTDSETWFGHIHPAQALARYRREMGIPARLIVVGMVSNEFSIADPDDPGMLDVVGFDTATPAIMSDFARA